MDDLETLQKRRAIKVILTDIFMGLSVVAIVCILVAAVAGWRINSDLTIQQNGLVSIKTEPASGKILIDGSDDQHLISNARVMLPSGEHKIEIEKDGYERWEKTVKVTPGWLLRLEYPRLIKQNREKTAVKEFENLKFFYVSPERNTIIYSDGETTEWNIISNLDNEPKFRKINVKGIFTGTEEGDFKYKINSIDWNKQNDRILINVSDINEWAVINLREVKSSVNLSKNQKNEIKKASFENESGEKVLAVIKDNLVRIDTSSKESEKVIDDVSDFITYGPNIAYVTTYKDGRSLIKILKIGDKNPTIAATNTDKNAKISFGLTRFNSISYFLYTINNHLYVFKDNEFPTGGGTKLNMKKIIDEEVGITPSEVKISENSEFISMREKTRVIIFDTELELYHEYDYVDENIRFLDSHMLYRVDQASGKFLAWDFDGTNVRTLVVDKGMNDFDALITPNGKYFYYIAKAKEGTTLIREKL